MRSLNTRLNSVKQRFDSVYDRQPRAAGVMFVPEGWREKEVVS
jgi:hypothetical protein